MNFARSLAAIRATFLERLRADAFEATHGQQRVVFHSFQAFIGFVTAGMPWAFPDRPEAIYTFQKTRDLDMSVAQFMARRPVADRHGMAITVRDAATVEFCDRHLALLLKRTYIKQWADEVGRMCAELNAGGPMQWLATLLEEPARSAIVAQLAADMQHEWGARSLTSFFEPRAGASPGAGKRAYPPVVCDAPNVIRRVIGADAFEMTIEPQARDPDAAAPYRWHASIAHNGDLPLAVARGTVYVFPRFARKPPTCARLFADSSAEADRLDVFEAQHRDADDLVCRGDIGFVWAWQRRQGTRKGTGAHCLRAAAETLKRRFAQLDTLVIDVDGQASDPAALAGHAPTDELHGRAHAATAVAAYAARLALPGYHVRTMRAPDR